MSRRSRFAVVVAAVASQLLLSACQTVATVTIDAEPDGSGRVSVLVELDQEAVAALGDAPVLTDGLEDAGWEATQDAGTEANPGLTLSVSKTYTDEEGLVEVLDEIGGSSGLFSDTFSDVREEAVEVTYEVGTTVSVSGDLAQFSDDELTELLDGLPLGRTDEELAVLGMDQPGAGVLNVEINVPGEGGSAESTFDLTSGEARESDVVAMGVVQDNEVRRRIIFGAAVAGVGTLLVIIGLLRRRGDRRRDVTTGDSGRKADPDDRRRDVTRPED